MKLKKKLGLLFVMISLLPFIGGMSFIVLKTGKTIQKNATDLLYEFTSSLAKETGSVFSDKIGFVGAFSLDPSVYNFDWDNSGPMLNSLAKQNGTFDSFLLVKKDGSYFRSDNAGNPAFGGLVTPKNTDPQSKPTLLLEREYFKKLVSENTKNNKLTTISDPSFSKSTGKKQIVIGTSLIDSSKTCVGMLAVTIDADILAYQLLSTTKRLTNIFGKDASLKIISNSGAVISTVVYDNAFNSYIETVLSSE
ncbi:MAG TPA: cache domain-containing protein, partial [Treponemataceae bacterium]|nr:cache domain-containing protein [Treponemataceae bacterium]